MHKMLRSNIFAYEVGKVNRVDIIEITIVRLTYDQPRRVTACVKRIYAYEVARSTAWILLELRL